MESVYWALSWACHRRCAHCYDDRFRPYVRDELDAVVGEGVAAYRKILANLPDDLTWRDRRTGERRPGRIILAGGEVLIDPVRERLFYPVLEAIQERYGAAAPRVCVQTTGDILAPEHIEAMLARGVWLIAISGMDDFHVGLEGAKREALKARIRELMAGFGLAEVSLSGRGRDYRAEPGPFFLFFGAQPKSWIGEIWPRGRAWTNGLSEADYGVNFCARQSGAKGFMNLGEEGSEVAIEPNGAVFPCCLKTKAPLGNLTEERLVDILESLKSSPIFAALNSGDPERMGESFGVDRAAFRAKAETTDPQGRAYANPCIGCDRLFEERVSAILADLRAQRLAKRAPSEA